MYWGLYYDFFCICVACGRVDIAFAAPSLFYLHLIICFRNLFSYSLFLFPSRSFAPSLNSPPAYPPTSPSPTCPHQPATHASCERTSEHQTNTPALRKLNFQAKVGKAIMKLPVSHSAHTPCLFPCAYETDVIFQPRFEKARFFLRFFVSARQLWRLRI